MKGYIFFFTFWMSSPKQIKEIFITPDFRLLRQANNSLTMFEIASSLKIEELCSIIDLNEFMD